MLQNGRQPLGRPQICYGMDPVTIGVAGLGLSAASTGMNVFGQITGQSNQAAAAARAQAQGVYQAQVQAAAQAAQAQWEKKIAEQKLQIAQRAEADSIQRGQVAEQVSRIGTGQVMGGMRARLAGQGTDFSGSATDVYGDAAAAGEFAALTIRNNAVREAYGHQLEQVDATNAWRLAQAKDDNARPGAVSIDYQGSNLGAVGSALAGASDLASKWWKFQQTMPGDPFSGTSPAAVAQPRGAVPVNASDLWA